MTRFASSVRAIVDTNVLISGLLSQAGAPGKIGDAIVGGRITPVFSPETIDELRDVLKRRRADSAESGIARVNAVMSVVDSLSVGGAAQ